LKEGEYGGCRLYSMKLVEIVLSSEGGEMRENDGGVI
jgi:hypothetical protein